MQVYLSIQFSRAHETRLDFPVPQDANLGVMLTYAGSSLAKTIEVATESAGYTLAQRNGAG
jgi:hypothetical protein